MLWIKKYREKLILLFLLLSSMVALFFVMKKEYTDQVEPVWNTVEFLYSHEGRQHELKPWFDATDQIWYLVMPSFVQEENVDLFLQYDRWCGRISLEGEKLKNGVQLQGLEAERSYQFEAVQLFHEEKTTCTLKLLTLEKLPTMMINGVGIEEMMAVRHKTAEPVNHVNCMLIDEAGEVDSTTPIRKLWIHGNWTATLSKSPFNLEYEKNVSLLNMNEGKRWVLLANATDGTYIRNKAMLDLANASAPAGAYQPDGEFVDVFVNGVYYGIYLLAESVNVEENRLPIKEREDFLYNIVLDNMAKYSKYLVFTEHEQLFELRSKKTISEEELVTAHDIANEIESALYDEEGIGQTTGKPLSELIDYDSWAWNWLMLEISADHDTGIASQYFYTKKDGSGKMYAGPTWDFDGIWGNVNKRQYQIPEALLTSVEQVLPEHNPNQNRWLSAAYQHEDFREHVRNYYIEHVREPLQELVDYRYDEAIDLVRPNATIDALRWNSERLAWPFVLPELPVLEQNDYTRFDTHQVFSDAAKEFVVRKQRFLEKLWVEQKPYHVVEVQNTAPFLNQESWLQTLYYWKEDQACLGELPWYDPEGYTFYGYQDVETKEYVTPDTVITKDCVLQAVWE